MREAGVEPRRHQHLRLVARRAAAGRVRLRRASTPSSSCCTARHRRQPRHGHRLAAAVAHHPAPRGPAGGRRRHHPLARRPPGLLPELAGLPRARPRPRRAGRRALRRPPRRRALARVERARLPQRALLLRRLAPTAFRGWLRGPLRHDRRTQRRRGAPRSGASATATWDEILPPPRDALVHATRRRRSTSTGSAPTSCSATTAPRPQSSASYSDDARHDELHGHRAHHATSTTGRGRRDMDVIANDHYLDHRLADPHAELAFAADTTRGLAGGAPWLLMEQLDRRRQLAAAQHRQGAGRDAPQHARPRRPRRRRRSASSSGAHRCRAARSSTRRCCRTPAPTSRIWREVVELGALRRAARRGRAAVARRRRRRAGLQLGDLVGRRPARPTRAPRPLPRAGARAPTPRSARPRRHRRRRRPRRRPSTATRSSSCPAVPGHAMQHAAVIADYVAGGGHALVTFFSGIVDEDDRVRTRRLPGRLPRPARRPRRGVRSRSPPAPASRCPTARPAASGRSRVGCAVASRGRRRYADGPLAGTPGRHPQRARRRAPPGTSSTVLDAGALRELVRRVARRGRASRADARRRARTSRSCAAADDTARVASSSQPHRPTTVEHHERRATSSSPAHRHRDHRRSPAGGDPDHPHATRNRS